MKENFQSTNQESLDEVKESKFRWIIVLLYVCTSTLTATVNYSFSPVTDILVSQYGATPFEIYYISVCFSAAFLLFSLPSGYIVENKGMKFVIGINIVLLTIGSGMR